MLITGKKVACYVVQRPFTKPTVSQPYPSKSFALEAADRIHGKQLRRVNVCDHGSEVWIGGVIVCSHRRAKAYKFRIGEAQ